MEGLNGGLSDRSEVGEQWRVGVVHLTGDQLGISPQ